MVGEVTIQEPALLVRLTEQEREEDGNLQERDPRKWDRDYLRDKTFCCWKLNAKRAGGAKYAFALFRGEVLAVYALHGAETTSGESGRVQLKGELAPDAMQQEYQGRSLKHYFKRSRSPVLYVGGA